MAKVNQYYTAYQQAVYKLCVKLVCLCLVRQYNSIMCSLTLSYQAYEEWRCRGVIPMTSSNVLAFKLLVSYFLMQKIRTSENRGAAFFSF